MPTPSVPSISPLLTPPPERASQSSLCPPEQVHIYTPQSTEESLQSDVVEDYDDSSSTAPLQQPTPPPADTDDALLLESPATTTETAETETEAEHAHNKHADTEQQDDSTKDAPSPLSTVEDSSDCDTRAQLSPVSTSSSGEANSPTYPTVSNSPFPKHRFAPNSTCSFLRHGSKFKGTQKSDRQTYHVQVEIKHVDMEESFLCGYLRIQGLTQDHPTLTTYFEGEIIGTKHTFQTRHSEWGSNEKTDMQHWGRFPAWRPLAKAAKRPDFNFKNFAQRENIFMRWKEYFLVPDHRVRTISGASFEGFYYICFNQVSGTVSGIYFHAKSEKYQQLELEHVEDHGCVGAIEFR